MVVLQGLVSSFCSNHITEDVVAQGTEHDYRAIPDQNSTLMEPVRSDLSENIEGVETKYAAAEDDPLPGIDGLRITGKAFPGIELQASGYSITGTTSCNFLVSITIVVQHILIFYQIPVFVDLF